MNPIDPRRLYTGTARGVWVSHDEGRRWTRPVGGLYLRAAGVMLIVVGVLVYTNYYSVGHGSVGHGRVALPDRFGGRWGVFLIYRAHW